MILADTSARSRQSARIAPLIGSPTGEAVAGHLPDRVAWVVPTMVQLEFARCFARELGEDKADQVLAFTQVGRVVPLDTGIAPAAAEACRAHRLATADATLFAMARARGAVLVTCAAHFEGLPGGAGHPQTAFLTIGRARPPSAR